MRRWGGRPLTQTGQIAPARSLDEAIARLEPADCCFAPVLSLDEAVETDQKRARGLVRRGEDGNWQALFPGRVDGEAPAVRRAWREV